MKRTSTYFPKPHEIQDAWRVIDATGRPLGRLARDIAVALQGKDKPTYTPHLITGDHVVVLNAAEVMTTGKKSLQKIYYRHSGYVGNLKSMTLKAMQEKNPEKVIELAVKGMLPHNHRGRQMLRRLKVYPGANHSHQAQTGNDHPAEGE
jgi:large subunit ribosomal protein L13